MSKSVAHPTTPLMVAAMAAVVALLAIGAGAGAGTASATGPGAPCGAATNATYVGTAFAVARQISAGESAGAEVTRAVQTIEADRTLANAVAGNDLAVVRSEVYALVFNHEHIVRLRVLRDGRVLDDLGGPLVLAPVSGPLTVNGRVVGTFVMSIQDDSGYQKLAERLVGAHVVVRYQGQTVLSDVAVGGEPLPQRGTVVIANVTYLVASFNVARFPAGELDVSLLLAQPPAALAGHSCAQVSAGVLADVAQRVYGEAITSPWWIGGALAALARTATLASAVAAGDDAGAAQIVTGMFAAGGFEGLDVLVGGRVIAGAGGNVPLVAPVTRPLVNASGAVVGQAVFAVETATGYASLAHAFTGAQVLVRAGGRQLAGSFAGPPTLPSSGLITYQGVRYAVASFAAAEFPNVPARVYVLTPA